MATRIPDTARSSDGIQETGRTERTIHSLFGSRQSYVEFIGAGIDQGRKPELGGGGLVRSYGGWKEVKRIRSEGHDRIKGDERILGDTEFVMRVISLADERLTRAYALKAAGYDLPRLDQEVVGMFRLHQQDLYDRGRAKRVVEARSLLCYRAVEELKISATDLARRLGLTQPAIGYAVARGRTIAREKGPEHVPHSLQ